MYIINALLHLLNTCCFQNYFHNRALTRFLAYFLFYCIFYIKCPATGTPTLVDYDRLWSYGLLLRRLSSFDSQYSLSWGMSPKGFSYLFYRGQILLYSGLFNTFNIVEIIVKNLYYLGMFIPIAFKFFCVIYCFTSFVE